MNLIKVKTAIVQAIAGLSAAPDDKWINRAIIFLELALNIVALTMFNCASFYYQKPEFY